jgi:hypothetical protein
MMDIADLKDKMHNTRTEVRKGSVVVFKPERKVDGSPPRSCPPRGSSPQRKT